MAALPAGLLLLGLAATNQAFAWGYWNGGGSDYQPSYYPSPGPGAYENGYSTGIADAVYDHSNGLAYNPVGQCLPCHSELYWNGFHEGYDKQWNTYNYQSTNQGTSINIYGNGNYVNTDQNSAQSSSPPELPAFPIKQGLCGSFGCESGGPDP